MWELPLKARFACPSAGRAKRAHYDHGLSAGRQTGRTRLSVVVLRRNKTKGMAIIKDEKSNRYISGAGDLAFRCGVYGVRQRRKTQGVSDAHAFADCHKYRKSAEKRGLDGCAGQHGFRSGNFGRDIGQLTRGRRIRRRRRLTYAETPTRACR